MIEFRPEWAKHVIGKFPPREFDPQTGRVEEIRVTMRCERCGASWQTTCASGAPRKHVLEFAKQHKHPV